MLWVLFSIGYQGEWEERCEVQRYNDVAGRLRRARCDSCAGRGDYVLKQPRSQYVEFWNNILVPKFVRCKHILVGGLTLHSEKIFPSLQGQEGR